MKKLELVQLEKISGETGIGGACVAIGAGSAVYGIGVATNFWNPVGWVSGVLLAADAACAAYAVHSMMSN